MIKRFLVFAFDNYYPSGGLEDLIAATNTMNEAIAAVIKARQDHYQIFDTETGLLTVDSEVPPESYEKVFGVLRQAFPNLKIRLISDQELT